jgi:hypothetical protein
MIGELICICSATPGEWKGANTWSGFGIDPRDRTSNESRGEEDNGIGRAIGKKKNHDFSLLQETEVSHRPRKYEGATTQFDKRQLIISVCLDQRSQGRGK